MKANEAPEMLRKIAEDIKNGHTRGIIGWNSNTSTTWCIKNN